MTHSPTPRSKLKNPERLLIAMAAFLLAGALFFLLINAFTGGLTGYDRPFTLALAAWLVGGMAAGSAVYFGISPAGTLVRSLAPRARASAEGIYLLVDPETETVVGASQAASRFYGYRRARLLGMPLATLDAPAAGSRGTLKRAAGSAPRRFTARHRLASGDTRDVSVYAVPLLGEGASLLHLSVSELANRLHAEREDEDTLTQVDSLYSLARAMITAPDLESLLRVFTRPIRQTGPCNAYLLHFEPEGDQRAVWGVLTAALRQTGETVVEVGSRVRLADYVDAKLLDPAPPDMLVVPDLTASEDDLWRAAFRDLLIGGGQHAAAAIPLLVGNDNLVGAVLLTWPRPRAVSWAERQLYSLLAPQLAALVEYHHVNDLREGESRFLQSVLGSLPIGVFALDEHGALLTVNRAFAGMTGREQQALLGERVWEVSDESNWWGLLHGVNTALAGEQSPPYETFFQRAEGDVFPAEIQLSPLQDAAGRTTGVIGTLEDLTRRYQARAALRESEERFRRVFDEGPLGMMLIDPVGRIVRANDTLTALLGYPHDELTGRDVQTLAVSEDNGHRSEWVAQLVSGRAEGAHGEQPLRRADGTTMWGSVTGAMLRDADGLAAYGLIMIEDVTERRRMEAAARGERRLSEALRDTVSTVNSTLELDEVFERIMENVGEVVPHDAATIMLLDGPQHVRLLRSREVGARSLSQELLERRLPLADFGHLAAMVETREPVVVENSLADPRWRRLEGSDWILSSLGAPILFGGEVIGFIHLNSAKAYSFAERDAERLMAFAEQVAVAIGNARLYESERRQRALAEALRDVTTAVSSTLDIDEVLDHILENVGRVVDHDAANVLLFEGDVGRIVRARGYTQRGLDDWLHGLAFRMDEHYGLRESASGGGPLCLPDTHADPGWRQYPETAWVRSHMSAPIFLDRNTVGFLQVDNAEPNSLTEDDAERLQAFADHAAIALRNARLYESERRQLALAQTLREVGTLLTAEMDIDAVLRQIIHLLAQVVEYDSASIQLIDRSGGLVLIYGSGFPDPAAAESVARQVLADTLVDRWADRDVIVIPDTAADPQWLQYEAQSYIRSWIGVALRVKGRLIGVLNVDHTEPGAYDESVGATVQAFGNQASIAIENARLTAESRTRNKQLEELNQITRLGTASLDRDELIQALAQMSINVIGGQRALITLWDPVAGRPVPVAVSSGRPPAPGEIPLEMPGGSLTERALRTGEPVLVPSLAETDLISDEMLGYMAESGPLRALLVLPLQSGENDIGALLIGYSEPRDFSPGEVAWASQAAELFALAISKARAYAEMESRVEQRTTELRSANQRLLALTRLKDEFISNVSHELRTPIASIKLYHHLMHARPERAEAYIRRLNRETERLETLIEDLLYLSRMDQGQMHKDIEAVDLNTVTRVLLEDRELLAERRSLNVRFEPDPDLPAVRGDRAALGRAVGVLVTNALNYTPEGGDIVVRTRRAAADGKAWATVSVADSGPGIPPEDAPRLFERFYRGETGRNSGAPGTGLGLAIAREIAEQHDGRIEMCCDDEPPGGLEGACFVITLPADEQS